MCENNYNSEKDLAKYYHYNTKQQSGKTERALHTIFLTLKKQNIFS